MTCVVVLDVHVWFATRSLVWWLSLALRYEVMPYLARCLVFFAVVLLLLWCRWRGRLRSWRPVLALGAS